jgi:hypothetical protein
VVVSMLGQSIFIGCPKGNWGESKVARFESRGMSITTIL